MFQGLKGKRKARIASGFFELMNNPYLGKSLAGRYKGCFSFRIWPLKVIYQIKKSEGQEFIYIIDIGPKNNIFEKK